MRSWSVKVPMTSKPPASLGYHHMLVEIRAYDMLLRWIFAERAVENGLSPEQAEAEIIRYADSFSRPRVWDLDQLRRTFSRTLQRQFGKWGKRSGFALKARGHKAWSLFAPDKCKAPFVSGLRCQVGALRIDRSALI